MNNLELWYLRSLQNSTPLSTRFLRVTYFGVFGLFHFFKVKNWVLILITLVTDDIGVSLLNFCLFREIYVIRLIAKNFNRPKIPTMSMKCSWRKWISLWKWITLDWYLPTDASCYNPLHLRCRFQHICEKKLLSWNIFHKDFLVL